MRLLPITALLTAAVGLGACGADDGNSGTSGNAGNDSAAAVGVKTFMFEPDPIRVDAGSEVTWTNQDSTVHTVTSGTRESPDGKFDADLEESGGTYSETFAEPGTYQYFCSRHSGPGMEGEVVVE